MRLNRDLAPVKGRKAEVDENVAKTVRAILADVKANGESAARKHAKELDGFTGGNLFVTPEEIEDAIQRVGDDFMRILKRAIAQITEYHANQIEKSWVMLKAGGVVMGQMTRPLSRVALYVPGGTAAYPSTLLMNAVPARLAGVNEIMVFTPVKGGGKVPDVILAAAACCGIDSICKIGGVQAVGIAAYGIEGIPKFDKIAGPGNAYVAAAKRAVYGELDIDMVAGPSEVLIIADETANPKYIAADMMSQAEHDKMASAMLVATSEKTIVETEKELERQLAYLKRGDIIRESLANFGAAVLTGSLEEAFEIANGIAPEHLEILTQNPLEKLPLVQNAGSIFLGENTPEPLGDYMSGTNHVLPTGGTAKFYSPLGVHDFVKHSAYSYYPREALAEFKDDVVKFAELEGLDAHANSIKVRFEP
ncbi:MAG: histidinol dehydrogenase [Clostridiales bacterium]|nr:histidinol dehydrogenase [Clostridiales bacterium]